MAGDYQKYEIVNGHQSWINGNYAIWFVDNYDVWAVGDLRINDRFGLTASSKDLPGFLGSPM